VTNIVELQRVEKWFGEFRALQGIDMAVKEGEFVSLLGPSGCGKTTSLRLIAGFENPSSGDVLIDGRSVVGLRADKRGVGIVFQNYALFPHMNVFENVAFGLRAQGKRRLGINARVREMLQLMELEQLEGRRVHELSGGQQQRVALARALAIRPRVLLLDEPLGALDKKLREQMQIVLMDLHRQLGMTMVYVTHDQEEALSMSQRVAVMRHGELVQYDTPATLYYDPGSLYVCGFVGRTNVLYDRVSSADGGIVRTDSGLMVASRNDIAPGASCAVCIRPERLEIVSDAGERTNRLDGRVLERIFLGQTTNYVIELDRGGRLEVSLFSDLDRSGATPGDPVSLSFAPEQGHVFELESTDDPVEAPEEVPAAIQQRSPA
jgi:spermidine/putrescine ABC transporter ATP-binding subunit